MLVYLTYSYLSEKDTFLLVGYYLYHLLFLKFKAQSSAFVDSIPDITHVEQLTFTKRYHAVPKKWILQFIPIREHNVEYLINIIISSLESNFINNIGNYIRNYILLIILESARIHILNDKSFQHE